MSTVVQQQQTSQAAIAAMSIGSASSCIQHLPDYRWHVHFGDFKAICGHAVTADCLRAFETMTDARITSLRKSANIPENQMPHEDDLWIEASTPDIDFRTLHVRDQSTYWYCLQEVTYPGRAKSLLDLGFLRRRFVAYPGRYMLEPVATTIHLDMFGNSFIIVDDDKQGYYVGFDGELHSAADEGYTVMRRQYLCCFDVINAALAKLAGKSPPEPMKRWHSLQRKALTSETTKSTASQGQSTTSQQTTAAQGCLDDEIKGKRPGQTLLFANKNNTDGGALSLENTENKLSIKKLSSNSVSLRSAPWSPETLIALAAHYLAIPDSNTVDEEQWRRDWLEPALWLIDFTKDLDCTRAWEIIERHVVGMLSGPTWYAQKRARKTSFTLRHVVGTDKNTAQFTGNTWHVVENELNTAQWYPDAHIEYAGPPLFDDCAESSYAQGYTAQPSPTAQPEEPTAQSDAQSMETAHYVESTAQVLGDDAQTEPVVEVVAGDDCAVDQVSTAQDEESAQSLEADGAQCAMETEMAAQPEQSDAQYATSIVRRKRRSPGMTHSTAQSLIDMVRSDYPMLALRMVDVALGFYLVRMQISDDQWYDFERFDDAQSPAAQLAIDAAEAYGKQRRATEGNGAYEDSQGPPGYGEGGDDSIAETREER